MSEISNILSMERVEKIGKKITYDPHDGGYFRVYNHESGKILKFDRIKCGLYTLDVGDKNSFSFIDIVEENE